VTYSPLTKGARGLSCERSHSFRWDFRTRWTTPAPLALSPFSKGEFLATTTHLSFNASKSHGPGAGASSAPATTSRLRAYAA
jgi:hypothetical protein